jgi:hypothetical protein
MEASSAQAGKAREARRETGRAGGGRRRRGGGSRQGHGKPAEKPADPVIASVLGDGAGKAQGTADVAVAVQPVTAAGDGGKGNGGAAGPVTDLVVAARAARERRKTKPPMR